MRVVRVSDESWKLAQEIAALDKQHLLRERTPDQVIIEARGRSKADGAPLYSTLRMMLGLALDRQQEAE